MPISRNNNWEHKFWMTRRAGGFLHISDQKLPDRSSYGSSRSGDGVSVAMAFQVLQGWRANRRHIQELDPRSKQSNKKKRLPYYGNSWGIFFSNHVRKPWLDMILSRTENSVARALTTLNKLCKEGQLEEGLEIIEQHQLLISRDIAYHLLLECTRKKCLHCGIRVHALMVVNGLDPTAVLGDHLIRLYASCGCLPAAAYAFNKVLQPGMHTWSSIISAHANQGQGKPALELYGRMQILNVENDRYVFLAALKACTSNAALIHGRHVHQQIIENGMHLDSLLGNVLVDMYAKCGCLEESHKIFDSLPNPDAVSWGAVIAGCTQQGEGLEALDCFQKMQDKGIMPDNVTLSSVLKACGTVCAIQSGRLLHELILNQEVQWDVVGQNTLIDMYAKCGSLEESCRAFALLSNRDVVSWNALMTGYINHDKGHLALDYYTQMRENNIKPNKVTFLTILGACSISSSLEHGRLIHSLLLEYKLQGDGVIGSSLIDMYAKCSSLDESCKVFGTLQNYNVVSWNALIGGYVQHDKALIALNYFGMMETSRAKPDKVTFSIILKACGTLGAIEHGRFIGSQIEVHGLQQEILVGNFLIDMYAKCDRMEETCKVFDKLLNKNLVSWNVLIAGLTKHAKGMIALYYFERMEEEGIKPDDITFSCILRACGNVGALKKGRLIHDQIMERGLDSDIIIGSTLIEMYARCGSLEESCLVFENLTHQDVLSWRALLAAYALHGEGILAINYFGKMHPAGIIPDKITFLSILTACSHAGLVDKGHWYLEHMRDYLVAPDIDHYMCLVDLLGRAGCLNEAEDLLKAFRKPSILGWKSLLRACKMHGKMELGRRCFDEIICLDTQAAPVYVLMSNIYAEAQLLNNL